MIETKDEGMENVEALQEKKMAIVVKRFFLRLSYPALEEQISDLFYCYLFFFGC